MKTLKIINVKTCEYLDKIPKQSWSKAHYKDTQKNNNVCNNMCEVFNSATKPYRSKLILTLLEKVRRIAMTSMAKNKLNLASHIGHLLSIQQSRLAKERYFSRYQTPIWFGDAAEVIFEVYGEPHNVLVDLGNHTCSCWSWQLSGLPCRQAIAAIVCLNENYVHAWLTMGSYNKTYEFHINPIKGEEMWDKSEYSHCLPSTRPKSHGRLKLYARKKDAHEVPVGGSQDRKSTKLKRQYDKFTCGTCGDVGHTTRGCEVAKKLKVEEAATAAE
ncbi:uncharacterized protein LOC107460358 [Arachis duranensis]|uniref:Uncharacterized protein LOC107460358 n=1 Tax=Arachis duranensis TaxID=130453 RepID=A0A6P4B0L0_ARADU|nr:uncharacterized protein LOC107460358 [Arachis duranensis]